MCKKKTSENKQKKTNKRTRLETGDSQCIELEAEPDAKKKKKSGNSTKAGSSNAKPTKTKKKQQQNVAENDSDSENSFDSVNIDVMNRLTRNGSSIVKLQKRIAEIENGTEIPDPQGFQCVICCDQKKCMVLYPCLHQHTCEKCWFLYKVMQINQISTYSEDSDDEISMPKCPVCRQSVEKAKKAIN